MSQDITCVQNGETDILSFEGEFNDTIVEKLVETISTLRQQGSMRILLLGNELERIQSKRLEELSLTIRVFRNMGGIIAIAEFGEGALKQLKSVTWYRYLNVFSHVQDALQFLNPSPHH